MIRNPITSAAALIAASLTLSACGNAADEANNAAAAANAAEANAIANIVLPPSISSSRTYRCRDNSVVEVDFMSDDSARIRTSEGAESVALAPAEGGNPPFTAEGYSVSANAATATIAVPGKAAQTCNARS